MTITEKLILQTTLIKKIKTQSKVVDYQLLPKPNMSKRNR